MVYFKGLGYVSQTWAFFPRVVCSDGIPRDNKNFKALIFFKRCNTNYKNFHCSSTSLYQYIFLILMKISDEKTFSLQKES